MQKPGKTLLVGALMACVTSPLFAQRQHVNGLVGEPPDVSNWPHPAAPDGNPYPRSTASPSDLAQRDMTAQLGKALFWDEQVSIDNTMACGTCHEPRYGGRDGRMGAVNPNGNFGAFGVIPQAISSLSTVDYGFLSPSSAQIDRSVTPVNPPTMIGAYLFNQLFWDMRAGPDFKDELTLATIPNFDDWAALEDLSVAPPNSDVEMGHQGQLWASGLLAKKLMTSYPLAMVDPSSIPPDVTWISSSGMMYDQIFDLVFASHPQFGGSQGVTRERFAMAVAHYQRTLIPDQAPIDLGTMTRSELNGFWIFDRSGCGRCHSASGAPTLLGAGIFADPFDNLLSDGQSHGIGLPGQPRRKTPTLRNMRLHRKFFSTGHGSDGIANVFVTNFNDLVTFFENQPGGLGTGPLSPSDRADFTAFLANALLDPRVANEQPPFDRPKLYSEIVTFEGNEYGVGTPSGGGPTPEIIANSPPLVVDPGASEWFKVGVGQTWPGSSAVLMISPSPATGPVIWVGPLIAAVPAPLPTNADGIGTVHMPFPLTTSVIGVPFYVQWALRHGRYGRSYSDAAEMLPFQW